MSIDRVMGLIDTLKGVNNNILREIGQAIKDERGYILDLNTESQLFEKGIGSDGIELASFQPYSDFTITVKQFKGQPTNRVTLRDEGDFHESFFIEFRDTEFEIKASDEKTESLKDKYGDEILGLTKESLEDITQEIIKPRLEAYFKNIQF